MDSFGDCKCFCCRAKNSKIMWMGKDEIYFCDKCIKHFVRGLIADLAEDSFWDMIVFCWETLRYWSGIKLQRKINKKEKNHENQ